MESLLNQQIHWKIKSQFSALCLLLSLFLSGCGGLFNSKDSTDTTGVTGPGSSYGYQVFTSPSVCAASKGSVNIKRKQSSSQSSSLTKTSPLSSPDPYAVSSAWSQSSSWHASAASWSGGGNLCSSASGGPAVFISGHIKNNLCPGGTIYFRCEGTAVTDMAFCCSSGHASCSSAVKTSTTTSAAGVHSFVPIVKGRVIIIPGIPSSKSKVEAAIYFGRNYFGGANFAGFYCRP